MWAKIKNLKKNFQFKCNKNIDISVDVSTVPFCSIDISSVIWTSELLTQLIIVVTVLKENWSN